MNDPVILMLIQLITGVISTLAAIILWPKTRDTVWFLIIIAVILNYVRVLLESLELFGIIRTDVNISEIGIILRAIGENIASVFLTLALCIMIARKT